MTTEEKWKPIPDFEHYEISSLGRVRKISYLRINLHQDGYPQVQLFKTDGCGKRVLGNKKKQTGKKLLLHRAIANAFIDNPENHTVVNHKDGDKGNYALDNLEWCTPSHNLKHAYDNGLRGKNKKTPATESEYQSFIKSPQP